MTVTLSGGPFGGEVHGADDWPDGDVMDIEGSLYRRKGDQAVYVGAAD